jgi:hypothetical protein
MNPSPWATLIMPTIHWPYKNIFEPLVASSLVCESTGISN